MLSCIHMNENEKEDTSAVALYSDNLIISM